MLSLIHISLEILKVDHDGVTPLEGAKFEITDDNGNVIATKTSGPDGKIKVDSILYGQYHWSEVEAVSYTHLEESKTDFGRSACGVDPYDVTAVKCSGG